MSDETNDDKKKRRGTIAGVGGPRVKKTLMGVGIPDAEEIAADLKEKAEAAKDAVSEVAEAAAEKASDAVDAVKEGAEAAKDAASGAVEAAADKASDVADSAKEVASDAVDSAKEAASDAADAVKEAASSAKDKVAAAAAAVSSAVAGDDDEETEETSADENPGFAPGDVRRPSGSSKGGAYRGGSNGKRAALYLAEYETVEALRDAAEQVRDAGYKKWDCHTPYPVHGLDDAMGLAPTKIGLISFAGGMTGLIGAFLMIFYMNHWDYPINIGGKPTGWGAFPSMVPVLFECTILLTGLSTLLGILGLNQLPRHNHPVFESDRFERSTDDRFFISIEVADKKFDMGDTRELLEGTSPSFLELVEEEV